MAAVTADQVLSKKEARNLVAFPVKSGETIYQNTLAIVGNDGYLYNLTSSNYTTARMVVVVSDGTDNKGGPAATTANGSLSGDLYKGSVPAGDKTVRVCWTSGYFLLTASAVAQSDVGKVAYATNNFTVDETQISGVPVGTFIQYVGSTTKIWVDLNKYYTASADEITVRGTITTTTATTPGLPFNVQNPFNEPAIVTQVLVDTTTASTAAVTIDVGISATSTTSNDVLIDAGTVNAIAVIDNLTDAGTNGGIAKATGTQYVTATTSATGSSSWAGTYSVTFRRWE